MRRTRFILAFVTAAVAVIAAGAPASSHFCSIPADINVGEEVMVNIGVAAEEKPVRDVDIEIPEGFTLKEPIGFMGYEPARRGKWVHFEGAEIQPFACHYFAFRGEAAKKGRLVARIVTTATDGTKTTFDSVEAGSLYPAMLIYAGVTAADFGDDESGSNSLAVGAIAVVAGGFAVGVAVFLRRRATMKG